MATTTQTLNSISLLFWQPENTPQRISLIGMHSLNTQRGNQNICLDCTQHKQRGFLRLTIKAKNTPLSKLAQPSYSLNPESPKVTFLYHCDFYVPIGTKYCSIIGIIGNHKNQKQTRELNKTEQTGHLKKEFNKLNPYKKRIQQFQHH
jgi:hypothetical protein